MPVVHTEPNCFTLFLNQYNETDLFILSWIDYISLLRLVHVLEMRLSKAFLCDRAFGEDGAHLFQIYCMISTMTQRRLAVRIAYQRFLFLWRRTKFGVDKLREVTLDC